MRLQQFFVGRAVGFAIVLAIIGVFLALDSLIYGGEQPAEQEYTLGTYAYRCDDGTAFTMQPAEGMLTLRIAPATSTERFGEAIVHIVSSERGIRYEGDGLVFSGIGETVTISTAGFTATCNPVNVPDEAPFNFGD